MTIQNQENKGTLFITAPVPVISVEYNGESRNYELNKPQMSIGRATENDIVIPYKTVSRVHAVLARTPNGYTIIDQNSTNGLLHRGAKVKECQLVDGDVIRIGDDIGNMVTIAYHDMMRPAQERIKAIQLTPELKAITIGRDVNSSIVLNYPQVSAQHAVIRREANGTVLLQDLDSTNGTFVRGIRLTPYQPLPIVPGEVFYIAGYQLIYQGDTIEQASENSVRLDVIGLTKKVNKATLTLLNNISLSIQPKEFVAVVGGSGAGKSTFMDALNGFRPAPEGKVLINGDDYYRNFAAYRSNIGYVPQDDIVHSTLTVERALFYAAKLRLPKDTKDTEINQRVAEVLEDVEMTHRKDVEISRLSGGQRKRVSIAVELLAKPNLFFLDEPTSGLDPGLDKRMMFLLRRLADQGRTIILITHATANISACDKVVFLAPGGRLAFFGSPHEALKFFEVNDFADIFNVLEQTGAEWEAKYRQSEYYQHYVTQPLARLPEFQQINGAVPAVAPPKPAQTKPNPGRTSGWRQFLILSRRYTELMIRDKVNLLVLLLQAPIIGLVLAMVAGDNIFADGKAPITTQRVLFILAVVSVWLGTSNAAREITKEKAVYSRERLVNLKVLPYVMSKVVVLAVLCFLQSASLIGMIVLRSGNPPNGAFLPAWLELFIGTWLTTMGGLGMGLLVSALVSNTDKAGSIVPILLVPQIILAGLIFPLEGAGKILSYATVSRWSIDSLGTSADLNRLYYQSIKQNNGPVVLSSPFDPNNYDDNPSPEKDYSIGVFNESRRDHLLVRWGILSGMIAIFLGLTGYSQKRKDKAWQRK
jgi:ABC transport system ATP-binding/permease protein